MSETMEITKRPGVVTFVGVVLYIQAFFALIIGIALLVERNNSQLLDLTGRDADYITTTAIVEIIIAVLLFLVASSLLSGAKWARLVVAIVAGIRMVVAGYWLIAHFGGGLQENALLQVGIGIFVLWALYGNDKSAAYFEGNP